jgi:hypothetical protein
VASWGWLESPFFTVCLNQGHFFLSLFPSMSLIFFKSISSKYYGERGRVGWPAGGSQLGVASWWWPAEGGQLGVASSSWLQSPFFIVCLNQGHFFLSLFSSISMINFEFLSSKYHVERGGEWGQGLYKNMNAQRNL